MDFVTHFVAQRKKLKSLEYVDILWQEISYEEGFIKPLNENVLREEYRGNLPLFPEDFFKDALRKLGLHDKHLVELNDPELIKYILTKIHWYTDREILPELPFCIATAKLSANLYFELLYMGSFHTIFKHRLFENSLKALEESPSDLEASGFTLPAVNSLRKVVEKCKLTDVSLEQAYSALCNIVKKTSVKTYNNFVLSQNTTSLCHEALLCIKTLKLYQKSPKQDLIGCIHLLTGARKLDTPDSDNIVLTQNIKTNFRDLIKNLKDDLSINDFDRFQKSIIYVISTDFDCPNELIHITTELGVKCYKGFAHNIYQMGLGKNVKNKENVMSISYAILCNPPILFYTQDKFDILVQLLLKNCILNCLNTADNIQEISIEILSNLCLLNKRHVQHQLRSLLNNENEVVHVSTAFNNFTKLYDRKWKNRKLNKCIIVIIVNMIVLSEKYFEKAFHDALEMISADARPYDFKSLIPVFVDLYVQLMKKGQEELAVTVLELLYSLGTKNAPGSADFTKLLYSLMLQPSHEVRPYGEKLVSVLLSDNFNKDEFFTLCQNLGLMRPTDVDILVKEFLDNNFRSLKLACAILNKNPHNKTFNLINHVIITPDLLLDDAVSSSVLYLINSAIKKCIPNQNMLKQNEKFSLLSFKELIKKHLINMTLPMVSVPNALGLLSTVCKLIKNNNDVKTINQEIDEKLSDLFKSLPNAVDVRIVIFASELVLLTNYKLSPLNLNQLKAVLHNYVTTNQDFSPDNDNLIIYCLTLYTRIAIREQEHSELAFKFLCHAFKMASKERKIILLETLYDLCNVVLLNFEELTTYLFEELKSNFYPLKRICAVYIDRLVRDEYLKLQADQFCKMFCLLGDPEMGLGIYLKKILSAHFVISNSSLIAKHFLPLICHVNFYSKHAMYPVDDQTLRDMKEIFKPYFNKWLMYSFLISSISIKSRFEIASTISKHIFDDVSNGTLKFGEGYWDTIKDSLIVIKIMTMTEQQGQTYGQLYKKQLAQVKKHIMDKERLNEPLKQPLFSLEIENVTKSLLQLLFFTDNENVLSHFKIQLFEAIMFWTAEYFADIVTIIKESNCVKLKSYYAKLNSFYERNTELLNTYNTVSVFDENQYPPSLDLESMETESAYYSSMGIR